MIKQISDQNRLRELAKTIWKSDYEELISELCDYELYTKVLDTIPQFKDGDDNAQVILCTLCGTDRGISMPILIPEDGYSYLFMGSMGTADELKQFEHHIHENKNIVILLFPNEGNRVLLLERKPRISPFLCERFRMLCCIHQ